jgi:hypothetical protein
MVISAMGIRARPVVLGTVLAFVWLSPGSAGTAAQDSVYRHELLGPLQDNRIAPAERVPRAIDYLKYELEHPTASGWGLAGGPIDTGYVQSVLVSLVASCGNEEPALIREEAARLPAGRTRELLLLALGLTRDKETVPLLLRLARTDPVPRIRLLARSALIGFLRPPRASSVVLPNRMRPDEKWSPLEGEQRRAAAVLFLDSLADPMKHFLGPDKGRGVATFPVQEVSANALRLMGYSVTPVTNLNRTLLRAWEVRDAHGRLVRRVPIAPGQGAVPLPPEALRGP